MQLNDKETLWLFRLSRQEYSFLLVLYLILNLGTGLFGVYLGSEFYEINPNIVKYENLSYPKTKNFTINFMVPSELSRDIHLAIIPGK